MTAPALVSADFVAPHESDISTGSNTMSFGEMSDPRSFDRHLRDAWVELTNKHFQSAEHVAVFFGVTERAARNWREGVTGPKGGSVAYAIKTLPGAAERLLGA